MSNLPPEIITEILYLLPIKFLIRFTSVSKWWYAEIHSPYFIKTHLNRSIKTNKERTLIFMEYDLRLAGFYSARFNDDDRFGKAVIGYQPLKNQDGSCGNIRFLGSCNGLVCIYKSKYNLIFIWNPLIRKFKIVPWEDMGNRRDLLKSGVRSGYGFGHDPVHDDYKILRIVRIDYVGDHDSAFEFELKVYSLREKSWKRVVQEWPKGFSINNDEPMVFLNGSLHCLVGLESKRQSESVLAFDLASETFRMYTTPFQRSADREIELEVLGGKLCVCVNKYRTLDELWVMEEYGVVSSWTKLYTKTKGAAVPATFDYCKLMVFSKDGKRVLLQNDYENLFWYDMKEKQSRRVRISDMPHRFQTAICVGSLVLIDGDIVIDPPSWEEGKRNKRKR